MNDSDIQTIRADFDISEELNISFQSEPYVDAEFGTIYVTEGEHPVLYATTATWNSQPLLVGKKGYIYIYSDYQVNSEGKKLAGMKVGDGNAYLIDNPFIDELYFEHIHDAIVHIMPEEREFWNNKVRCYMSDDNTRLIFTTE